MAAGLRGPRIVVLPDTLFQTIAATETSQGVIALVEPPAWSIDQLFRGRSLVIVLDGLQDPGNAGAIARAAEAFGATGLMFLKGTVSPFHPKTLRASAGSLFRMPFVSRPRCAAGARRAEAAPRRSLRSDAVHRFARRSRAMSISAGKCAIVIGSEGRGVSQATARDREGCGDSDRGRRVVECSRGGFGIALRSAQAASPRGRGRLSLFDASPFGDLPADPANGRKRPLADRMRPETLDDFAGQEHILGPGKPLRSQIERDQLTSIILWGPPGVGKTTLARIIARMTKSEFLPFSAVLAGIKEIKAVMADAERLRKLGRRTILFIDEIHRFNKAQQDAFLPYVEKGDIILIGATTENPSFEVNAALLSRSKVYMLRALTTEEIVALLRRALPVVGVDSFRRDSGTDCRGRERRRALRLQHARSRGRVPAKSPSNPSRTRWAARFCSTTRPAKSTTT